MINIPTYQCHQGDRANAELALSSKNFVNKIELKGEAMAGFIQATTEIIMKACFNSWLKDARILPTKSGVYLNYIIEDFLKDIRSTMYWLYSAEEREIMTSENSDFIKDLQIDRMADEETDGKIIMLNQRLKNK